MADIMDKTQKLVTRHNEASSTAPNGDLLREAGEALARLYELTGSLALCFKADPDYRLPLSDGVSAEVKIIGQYSAKHVHIFAELFAEIAKRYEVPKEPADAR